MRLIKCYIENFGKLAKVDFDFSNPTILEKNGFGKTTLSNFIKSMFFGFESDNIKTRKDENNDRKKYYPWQGGAFGGNIVFEQNNKQYKIERFFGESKAKDTFVLYDLSTNKESFEYTSEIGKELFGLDGESFERCLYIPQKNIEVTNTESLSTKLNSMIENTDFGVGFDIAKNCKDNALAISAFECAKKVLDDDGNLEKEEHALLRLRVDEIYKERANTIN